MDEGINDLDEFDVVEEEHLEDPVMEESTELSSTDDEIIQELLKSKGIIDPTKIKFDKEDGNLEEVDWNTLSKEDKLDILNNDLESNDLDLSEIELINAIRKSQLTPAEYIQYLQRQSVESYLLNQQPVYSVDQYSDEELYVLDLMSKSKDINEEEAREALEKAKSNETLFKKLMAAVRNDYKHLESENILQMQLQQEQESQAQYNQFAEQIGNSILNFKEYSGYELNMTNEDMEDLYNLITGYDKAGNNWFNKLLQDPPSVVKMAWFILNGELMIQDINEYYQKEISDVRKKSYNKGLNDAKSKVAYKPKDNNSAHRDYDDLDDF